MKISDIITVRESYSFPLKNDFNVELLSRLTSSQNGQVLLSSVNKQRHFGRLSLLALNPVMTATLDGDMLHVSAEDKSWDIENPLQFLTSRLPHKGSPFSSGAWLGYLGYDAADSLTNIVHKGAVLTDIPAIWFAFHDTLLVIDHAADTTELILLDTSYSTTSIESRKEAFLSAVKAAGMQKYPELRKSAEIFALIEKEEYTRNIATIKEGIYRGDFYQVNYTYPLKMHASEPSDMLFTHYMDKNPVDYSAYIHADNFDILSLSPECFFTLKDGVATSSPIKGTIARGATKELDEANRKELVNSEKDIKELSMIVDLIRNDLGRVSHTGSVRVKNHASIEQFSTLYHLYTRIESTVAQNSQADLLHSLFPGGSITGAPKLKAMETISELEKYRRGVYTGSIGWISMNGDMGFSIAIRTVTRIKDELYYFVGGGIVADSDIESEYRETLTKAASFWNIFEKCTLQ
ncbi:anthranilate synthase component I family protein [bacterium]|nr:anthranilate synthase component I family protein [bacterium]